MPVHRRAANRALRTLLSDSVPFRHIQQAHWLPELLLWMGLSLSFGFSAIPLTVEHSKVGNRYHNLVGWSCALPQGVNIAIGAAEIDRLSRNHWRREHHAHAFHLFNTDD